MTLDDAWEAAEEALGNRPPTWLIEFGRRDTIAPMENPTTGWPVSYPDHYFASATKEFSPDHEITTYGPSPVAALQALTEKLRGLSA